MEFIVIPLCALVGAAVVALSLWARRNQNPLHHVEDPETDISEEEWSRAHR